jgi:hypothetical protein
MAQDEEIQFALGVIDDHRRLIVAGKTHRWDIVKWTVTINVALAAASIALKQQHANAEWLFSLLALVVVALSVLLMWEITRRMTATRNASLAPEKYLIEHGIDVFAVTKEKPPEPYPLSYDKEELRIYAVILAASAAPAFLLWLCRASIA